MNDRDFSKWESDFDKNTHDLAKLLDNGKPLEDKDEPPLQDAADYYLERLRVVDAENDALRDTVSHLEEIIEEQVPIMEAEAKMKVWGRVQIFSGTLIGFGLGGVLFSRVAIDTPDIANYVNASSTGAAASGILLLLFSTIHKEDIEDSLNK